MAIFINQNRNSSVFTNELRHGRDTTLRDIADLTFNDKMWTDGKTIADITFAELQDTVWVKPTKNSSTFTNELRN